MRVDSDFFKAASAAESEVEKTRTLEEDHTRYHRAAIDGYVDMLCEVSKRDANLPSKCNEFTPTLLAAYHGHLEALRMLVGRGGDPEKSAADGSNALHLAASRNHLNCVSFLVNFGVNMWALDNELHTAKDVAAMLQRKEVLDYLDQMMAKQSALNTKNVQKLKEKAKLAAERRLKKLRKAQLRAIKLVEKDERYLAKLSNSRRLLKSAHSISDIKLVEKCSTTSAVSSCERLQIQLGDQQKQQASSLRGCVTASEANRFSNSSSLAYLIRSNLLGRAKQLDLRKQVPIPKQNLSSTHHNNKSSSSCSASSISSSASNLFSAASQTSSQIDEGRGRHAVSRETRVDETRRLEELASVGVLRKLQLRRKNPKTRNQAANHYHHHDSKEDSVVSDEGVQADESRANKDEQCPIVKSSGSTTTSNQLIKWPPAPVLSRAISEPDFGSAVRGFDDEAAAPKDVGLHEATIGESMDCCGANVINLDRQLALTSPTCSLQAERITGRSVAFVDQGTQRDACQHQLLTQCLSQLKLHHEAINKQHQQQFTVYNDNPMVAEKYPMANSESKSAKRQQSALGSHSDELLQLRQLNQGRQPLKPSVIKQNQQLHYPQQTGGLVQVASTKVAPFINNNNNNNLTSSAPKSGNISIDSIGSAGSFVHRNARFCESSSSTSASSTSSHTYCKSSKTSTDLTSSICSSTCASSIEVGQLDNGQQQLAKQQLHVTRQLHENIETFLNSNGLSDLSAVFASEKIDLEALVLLTEADLKSLNILLGPRRKLLKAIEKLQTCTQQLPMYLMMEAQL